ncbi:MAG: hypothetical protein LQ339_000565 [Xanthoria mediterranea]|nr:MAG: hypothetical protein LQ339_000565 [Xanthoria mediterranea]
MPSYFNLLAFSLFIFGAIALPTSGTSAISSSSANTIHGDPVPTATGPTCIQTRSPEDPSASDISAAIEKDDSITKACDVASQGTTTLDNGLLPLSVIYYGDKNYFFNSSHAANVVSRPVASPKLCPNTFHDIFSTCVVNGNFWGGWVMSGGTNRSITNYVYPSNPLPHEGSRSSSVGSLGNGPGTQISDTTTKDAGTSRKGNQAPTTTTSSSSGDSTFSGVKESSTDSDNTALPESSTDVPSSPLKTTIEGASTTTEPSRGTGQHLPEPTTRGEGTMSGKGTTSEKATTTGKGTTTGRGTTTEKSSNQSTDKTTSSTGAQTEEHIGVKTGRDPSETTTGTSESSTSKPDSHASSVPLPPGGTILSATTNSQFYSETFIPTTLSKFVTLASTLTTSTRYSESSSVPLVIGPGGVAWVPLHQPSGTNPELSPPTILPSNPNAPTRSTTTESNSGTQRSSSGSTSSRGAPSSRASITAGGPSQTTPPRTTGRGDTTTKDDGGSSTTKKGDDTITNALPIITTSYDPEASKVSSIGPGITGNTAIRTSDDHHGVGIFPPTADLPPPTPPPFPNIKWPTITIDDDLKPTATEEPDDEPTSSEDDDESTTAKTTSKPTSS